MNALARYIQRFDVDEAVLPVDRTLAPQPISTPEISVDKVAEAEAEGRRWGRAEAERAFEVRLAAEREGFALRLAEERARWSAEEGERIAEAFTVASRELEAKLAAATARALVPFISATVRERAIADLCSTLETLLADGQHPVVRISGPQDLINELSTRLGPRADGLTFEAGTKPDVRVVADSTIIESQLGAWLNRLSGIQE